MKFIYFFLKFFKTRNKVTFLSRQSNEITLDFSLIIKELQKRDSTIEFCVLCKRFNGSKKNFIEYGIYTLRSMYHIATSKVCIIDSYCLPNSVLNHKKSLKVLQIWHSLGAIKKFGYQTIDKKDGRCSAISNTLNMHKNYNNIISGSNEMTNFFSEAFNYDKKVFLNYGLPRIDYLIKNESKLKKKILSDYPSLKSKKNILYVPTFRKTNNNNVADLVKNINFDKYNLIVKSHVNQILSFDKTKVLECPKYASIDLLTISDYIITDYSAIAIEAAILNKKTYYYVFDYEEYKENNGLNIDLYKEMPGCVFEDAKALIEEVEKEKYDLHKLFLYKEKYLDNKKGNSTKLIVNKICEWLKEY